MFLFLISKVYKQEWNFLFDSDLHMRDLIRDYQMDTGKLTARTYNSCIFQPGTNMTAGFLVLV